MWTLPATEIERLIVEDAPGDDLTSEALGFANLKGVARFATRSAMVLAGSEIAAQIMRACGAEVAQLRASGSSLECGVLVLEARGSALALHRGYKVAQTLMEITSGMATATRALVDVVRTLSPEVRIACTRKAVPGARRLSHLAVKAGGGTLHRMGLSDTVLVFDQHRVFRPEDSEAVLLAKLRYHVPERRLAIEVRTTEEAFRAIKAGFDTIQLEKFPPPDVAVVAAAARASPKRPLVAAAGGISPDNVGDFIRAEADIIVTSWPYTAKPRDVAVSLALEA